MTQIVEGSGAHAARSVARIMAAIAVLVWIISLSQTGFVVDSGADTPNSWVGLHILASGWLGLIQGIVAWFANLSFIAACGLLFFTNRSVTFLSVLSVLLALDTFRLTQLGGGGRTDVYAWGLGAALWVASMLAQLIAAGARKVENARSDAAVMDLLRSPLVLLGAVGLVATVGLTAKWTWDDRSGASATELHYLKSALFKKGEVCKAKMSGVKAPLELDGPFSIVGRGYPLDSPLLLLSWGISVVRKDAFDYSLADPNDVNSIVVMLAQGPSSLELKLEQSSRQEGRLSIESLRAVLVAAADGKVGFDQTWNYGGANGRQYCPDLLDYSVIPAVVPRSLLLNSIQRSNALIPPKHSAIKGVFDGLGWPPQKTELTDVKQVTPLAIEENNLYCRKDIGLVNADQLPSAVRTNGFATQGFRVGERLHLLRNMNPLFSVCNEQDVYLYEVSANSDKKSFLLSVQKRSVDNFTQRWTTRVQVDYVGQTWRDGEGSTLRIKSITERLGKVLVEIYNDKTRELMHVQFETPRV